MSEIEEDNTKPPLFPPLSLKKKSYDLEGGEDNDETPSKGANWVKQVINRCRGHT